MQIIPVLDYVAEVGLLGLFMVDPLVLEKEKTDLFSHVSVRVQKAW